MQLGRHPQPNAPWRPLIFRVHCVVTERWMKIRVPFAWFWFGDSEYGTPEVESGTIASTQPKPPEQVMAQAMQRAMSQGPRLPAGAPVPLDAGPLPEAELAPYRTPKYRDAEEEPPMNAILDKARQLEAEAERLRRLVE